jgi:predicted DNA-binding transcriptional regulator YafY
MLSEKMNQNIHALETAANANMMVEFIYIKPKGEISVRTVVPTQIEVSAKGDHSIFCYDLGRRMVRRYRIDRIQGEVIIKGPKPREGYDSTPFEVEEFGQIS